MYTNLVILNVPALIYCIRNPKERLTVGTYTNNEQCNEDNMILILDKIANKTKGEQSLLLLNQYRPYKIEKK